MTRLIIVDNAFARAVRAIVADWQNECVLQSTRQRVEEVCEGDRPDQIWATLLLLLGLRPEGWQKYYSSAWAEAMGLCDDIRLEAITAAASILLDRCAYDPTPPTLTSTSGLAAGGRIILLY
ncbi:TPA: hypothetical protein DEB00_01095 [Candidatus Uhrbacteria bacterium]|nr:hypothetical protein [Candidatus Uhrbacteria bacterium]